MTRLRCAILDDYFNVALTLADWSRISDRVDVTVFNHPFASEQAAASALAISRSSARCGNARHFRAACSRRCPS